MPIPAPEPGRVLHYNFLWSTEAAAGATEGAKARPSVIVMAVTNEEDETIVIVVPITHSSPHSDDTHIEMPAATCRRLGLDDQRSWIVVAEMNKFVWPRPDLRRIPGNDSLWHYGDIPPKLFEQIKAGVQKCQAAGQLKVSNPD
jgi:uncharacterized protein YifN (PemK superfamily)